MQQHAKRTKTLSDEEKRWKLRDKCLRVATYYRLMGMRSRSEHRTRLGASKKVFWTWAKSVIEQRRESKRLATHERESEQQRLNRKGNASAHTRMHIRPLDLYTEHRPHKRARTKQRPADRKRKRLPTLTQTHR